MSCSTLVALALIGTLNPAASARSSFRLTGVEPARGGASLVIAYDNDWGPDTNANADVQLYGHIRRYNADGSPKPIRELMGLEDTSMPLGCHRLIGTGTLKLPVDYAACKVKPGQQMCLSGIWVRSKHRWGENVAQLGRGAGEVTLPEPLGAAQNSALRRAQPAHSSRLRSLTSPASLYGASSFSCGRPFAITMPNRSRLRNRE